MYNKRYSLALKTGCFLLLLVALVAGVAGGVAACYLADQGAYTLSREDLLEQGSLAAAREKGLVGMEGKDYVVQDGDVILFRFNV